MATDLLDREQAAAEQDGNTEDGLNVGQQNSDALFNKKNAPQSETNEDFDNIIAANYGKGAQGEKVDSHGDKVKRNYNADDPAVDSNKNIDKLNNAEKSGGPNGFYKPGGAPQGGGGLKAFGSKLAAKGRNVGPSAGIAGLLIGSVAIGGSIIAVPAALFGMLEKSLVNDTDQSSGFNIRMHRAYMGTILGADKKNPSTDLEKKLTTTDDEQVKKLKDEGFNPDTAKDGDRNVIKSVEFSDKTKAETGAKFNAHTEGSIQARDQASGYFSERSSVFNDSPKLKKILAKFGIKKTKVLKGSDDRDSEKRRQAVDSSFNENTSATTDENREAKVKAIKEEADGKTGKFAGRAGNLLSAAVSTVCTAYNTVRVATAVVKAKYIYDLIAFAYPFIQAASQIENQGDIDPSVVENLGDRLTWSSPDKNDKENYNQNAFDSQGLKAVFYGDWASALDATASKYSTGAIAVAGTKVVKDVETTVGKDNLKNICRANRTASAAASVTCLAGPWALAICGTAAGLLAVLGPLIAEAAVKALMGPAEEIIKSANLNSNLKGKSAGDALSAGIALLMMQHNMGSGMKPAQKGAPGVKQVKKYISATNDDYMRQEELAQYQAKKTPFDMYNSYSFAGRVVAAINPYVTADHTGFARAANIVATVASAPLSLLNGTASALHSQPSMLTKREDAYEGRSGMCNDDDVHDIGASCDLFGQTFSVASPNVLDMADQQASGQKNVLGDNIQFMKGGGFINDSGKPTDIRSGGEVADDPSTDFGKWIKYCTEKRTDPIGTTSSPSDDPAEDKWRTGENCLADDEVKQHSEMIDNFAFYWNMCTIQFPASEGLAEDNCWDQQTATTAAPTGACAGGGNAAIYTCALKYDNYRYLWGGGHGGNAQQFIADFNAGKTPEWTQILDCSGLVRMAYVEAMGVEDGAYVAPGGYDGSANWEKIPVEQAKQGDIVTEDGHVAIVESNDDPGSGRLKIFDAETDSGPQEQNIQHSTASYGQIIAAYRAKKP
jgi:hypothetical protein